MPADLEHDFVDLFALLNHPAVTELDRRRYEPTGSRELWVRYGAAGPPAELPEAA